MLRNKSFIRYSATEYILSKNKEFLLKPDCAPNSELHNCCMVTDDSTHSTVLGLAMKETPFNTSSYRARWGCEWFRTPFMDYLPLLEQEWPSGNTYMKVWKTDLNFVICLCISSWQLFQTVSLPSQFAMMLTTGYQDCLKDIRLFCSMFWIVICFPNCEVL